jgi:hypothetical protein
VTKLLFPGVPGDIWEGFFIREQFLITLFAERLALLTIFERLGKSDFLDEYFLPF